MAGANQRSKRKNHGNRENARTLLEAYTCYIGAGCQTASQTFAPSLLRTVARMEPSGEPQDLYCFLFALPTQTPIRGYRGCYPLTGYEFKMIRARFVTEPGDIVTGVCEIARRSGLMLRVDDWELFSSKIADTRCQPR